MADATGRRMTVTAASCRQRCMDRDEERMLLVLRRVAETRCGPRDLTPQEIYSEDSSASALVALLSPRCARHDQMATKTLQMFGHFPLGFVHLTRRNVLDQPSPVRDSSSERTRCWIARLAAARCPSGLR